MSVFRSHAPALGPVPGIGAIVERQLDTNIADRPGEALRKVGVALQKVPERIRCLFGAGPVDMVADSEDAESKLQPVGDDADAGVDRGATASRSVIARDDQR